MMDDRRKCACVEEVCAEAPAPPNDEREALAHLEEVWRMHSRELLERCVSWSGGRADDGREAFSRAWSRAAASIAANRPRLHDPLGWLLTIAYRTCMDLHRERTRRSERELDIGKASSADVSLRFGATSEDPERLALNKELGAFLRGALEQLPPRLRDSMLTYMRSGDYRDVEARFGITDANARKRIQQARAILRERLGDYHRGGVPRRRR